MALATHVSDASNVGAGNTSTAGVIGKSSTASSAIDADIAYAFAVGGNMRLDDAEQFRQGDMWNSVLRFGPKFFVPMLGGTAGLYDLAVPGNWTATGSPASSEDPPIPVLSNSGGLHVIRRLPTVNLKSVGGGATPAGSATKLITKSLGGSFT
jgi:hypothetical protein